MKYMLYLLNEVPDFWYLVILYLDSTWKGSDKLEGQEH